MARFIRRDRIKEQYRINERIRIREIRLVGDNVEQGIYPTAKAYKMAQNMGLDLVEISPSANPPVCQITDYQKFLYQQKKRQKEQKAKSVKVVVKEIRFGPHTDDHDYDFKLKHAKEFLESGCKVKAFVFFRGRSILFKEQGEVLLLRFANDLEDYGKVDRMPVLEGKRMILMFSPKKIPVPAKKKPAASQKPKNLAPVKPKEETKEEPIVEPIVETKVEPKVEPKVETKVENENSTKE